MKRIAIMIPNQKQLDLFNDIISPYMSSSDTTVKFNYSQNADGTEYIDIVLYEEGSNEPRPWTNTSDLFFDKFGDGPYIYRQVHDMGGAWQFNLIPLSFVGTKEQIRDFEFALWKKLILVRHPWAIVSLVDKTDISIICHSCNREFSKPTKYFVSLKDLPVMTCQCPNCKLTVWNEEDFE